MKLPIEGEAISSVDLIYSLTLNFGERRIRIGSALELYSDDGRQVARIPVGFDEITHVDPERFVGVRVTSATYSENGQLELVLDSGDRIVVHPDEDYEAWEFSGYVGENIVVLPGGGIA